MLKSVYGPGELLPDEIDLSWDCEVCDSHCEVWFDAGELMPLKVHCYRCGAVTDLPRATIVETGEYTLEELFPEEDAGHE